MTAVKLFNNCTVCFGAAVVTVTQTESCRMNCRNTETLQHCSMRTGFYICVVMMLF